MFKAILRTVICGSAMAACALSANAQTLQTSGSNVGIGGTNSNAGFYIKPNASKSLVLSSDDPNRTGNGPIVKAPISVGIDGQMQLSGNSVGITLYSLSGYGARLSLTRETYSNLLGGNATHFAMSTSSYQGSYYPIIFAASSFYFDRGDVTINGKLTCKDELNVVEVNSEKIRTSDITVDMNNAADYVFDENYNLKSLGEVESFVKENKHLPGVPSAAEMAKNGMSVSEMSNLLLEKVEELTLHMIQLEKENKALKAKFEMLEK
ncbi:MAG: hypothetical protein J6Y37_15980 [Paludibacteraceae bacterium]|nr:hypothetical protein [Paludibacteraceae bacterium]